MGDPAILLESVTSPVVTAIPTLIAGVTQDATKTSSANKNGKKADSGSSSSFFTWFIVLALLGVWTSVAVVYFDLVDYQGVLDKAKGLQINLSEALQGKLVAYDTDGDGDFDVEDAKVLLGLTSEGDGQGESEILDWLEEVEEGGSDWLNSFFTFLYGLINPLEHLEEEEQEEYRASGGLYEVQEDDEEDEDDRGVRKRGANDNGYQGQKIVIVGLHNQ
ncbi:Aspartyl/asparaginyl beta-hydroxylase [Dissostichus eleginoides]|uniref:Aspartyl/asparaginyl beta-hydroxylase n=1 Tax=Dissostichus eleginoides TaxID=100907 RepID=A0AAD9B9L0_DISEL|nr:Aspartyl/asparaginyl beta-hydroxylase [Dissostichus eleginoides]